VTTPPFGPEEADRSQWDWDAPHRWGLAYQALGDLPENFVDAVPATAPDGRAAYIVGTRGPSPWIGGLENCQWVQVQGPFGPAESWVFLPGSEDDLLAAASHRYTVAIPGAQPPPPRVRRRWFSRRRTSKGD